MFGVVNATSKQVLVQGIFQHHFHDYIKRYVSSRLVDIGYGKKPYRELLAPYISEHVGVDHADSLHGNPETDIIGSAYEIDAPDNSFDAAACTAVLLAWCRDKIDRAEKWTWMYLVVARKPPCP